MFRWLARLATHCCCYPESDHRSNSRPNQIRARQLSVAGKTILPQPIIKERLAPIVVPERNSFTDFHCGSVSPCHRIRIPVDPGPDKSHSVIQWRGLERDRFVVDKRIFWDAALGKADVRRDADHGGPGDAAKGVTRSAPRFSPLAVLFQPK